MVLLDTEQATEVKTPNLEKETLAVMLNDESSSSTSETKNRIVSAENVTQEF